MTHPMYKDAQQYEFWLSVDYPFEINIYRDLIPKRITLGQRHQCPETLKLSKGFIPM